MTSRAKQGGGQIEWLRSSPFFLLHLAAPLGIWLVGFKWSWLALAVASYYMRMFFVTSTYHRYLAHRSYKMGRMTQFVFCFMAQTTLQKGALWWAANHRLHHKFSDTPEDLHSPSQHGFWWSHVGWILSDRYTQTRYDQIQDFAKFPELVFLNNHYVAPALLWPAVCYAIGGMPWVIWGWVVSTVLLWHGTFTINSLSHVFGWRRYDTADTSRNNPLLALITMGEGWHNNHHRYMSSVNQGFFWWEFDITYAILKALSWSGIVWDLRKPPLELLDESRVTTLGRPAKNSA